MYKRIIDKKKNIHLNKNENTTDVSREGVEVNE